MKVGFITNLRAPYRTLQLNEYSSIEDIKLTAYYTDKPNENRKWKIANNIKFKEVDLRGYKLFKDYGYLNNGLINIVRNNDVVILGCYEQTTYILLSILCRIFNKPYILSFDGIGTDRIVDSENKFKKFLKKIVINGARYIMGNGKVSKEYFSKVFNYDGGKIYNQYLTVDTETINELYKNREVYRQQYRKALNIEKDEKVLIYSGRLISVKNVKAVIRALAELGDEKITLLITGGGELESEVKEMANILNVKVIVTGFIREQQQLFKHYFAGDALILPSTYEPWGLVINEAMAAGLPVIVSKLCGCSMDLVEAGKNGYLIDPYNINDISEKISKVFRDNNLQIMGDESKKLISSWTFKSSKENLNIILKKIYDTKVNRGKKSRVLGGLHE